MIRKIDGALALTSTAAVLVVVGLLLGGCTSQGAPAPSVCAAVAAAQANPTVVQALAPQVATNAQIGQIWQYLQSGCSGAQPAPGVNPQWTAQMLQMLQTLAPTVLPILIGLI